MVKKVDRLIGICNNTDMSPKEERKGCAMINIASHRHLDELPEIFPFLQNRKKKVIRITLILFHGNHIKIWNGWYLV